MFLLRALHGSADQEQQQLVQLAQGVLRGGIGARGQRVWQPDHQTLTKDFLKNRRKTNVTHDSSNSTIQDNLLRNKPGDA